MKNIIVFYHKDCRDGFSAAWAARKKLGNKADYIAVTPDPEDKLLKNLSGKTIYFLDSGPNQKERIENLAGRNNAVILIDHHKSRNDTLGAYTQTLFDLKRSGAVLAWKYFHSGKKVPALLRYVEDYDLGKFALPYSKEISASLDAEKIFFARWDSLIREFESAAGRKKYINAGKAILKYIRKSAEDLASSAEKVVINKQSALAVNSALLQNEISRYCIENLKAHLVIVWCRLGEKIRVHLRSDARVDSQALARRYGGGGHPGAGGFSFDARKPFPWEPI